MDNIRREYEEFFDVLTDEHSAHRRQQFEETEKLKVEYESYKQAQFEEKRLIVVDYQNLIFSMQNQFEEYRAVTEFLFNGEIAKAEDELATLSLRFEQEILYIIQAKDKFYTDLMVAKDAKIMHLIEGSDLQVIMRKHEGDIENIRKDHAKDIERVKTEQESEQKSLVTLLQRQNASLESKTEKLQAHIKMLETKTKDLTAAVEHKTRALLDKEAEKLRTDEENTKTRAEMETKFRLLAQEKEHLRHKVIRLNFSARGKGADSVENIIKRVSREQESLALMYDELMEKYGTMLKSNEVLGKKLREKEKLTAFLEKEIGRRNKELESMTKTFAIFLDSRMKQTAQLSKSRSSADSPRQSGKEDRLVVDVGGKNNTPKSAVSNADRVTSQQMTELERGYAYLHRFKTLSRAFVSGDYRKVQLPKAVATDNQITGPWKNTELYAKMEGESAEFARMYGASLSKADDGTGSIPATTLYQSLKVAPIPGSASHVKVYGGPEEDPTTAVCEIWLCGECAVIWIYNYPPTAPSRYSVFGEWCGRTKSGLIEQHLHVDRHLQRH